jgi:glutathione S-transferase
MTIAHLLTFVGASLRADFLFGDEPSVADFNLFVMLLWADRCSIEAPLTLANLDSG